MGQLELFKVKQANLKTSLLEEAKLIQDSVDWLARQIEIKLLEIDEAENNHNYDALEQLKLEAFQLLLKLNRENSNMNHYMAYYHTIIQNEKKALLSFIGEKESLSLWRIPTDATGQTKSAGLSGEN